MGNDTRMGTLGVIDNDVWTLQGLRCYFEHALTRLHPSWYTDRIEAAVRQCAGDDCPTMLLIDMSLNGIAGSEIIRRIRQQNRRLVIVAMTAFPLEVFLEDAMRSGAQTIVSKRYPKTMADTLESFLDDMSQRTIDGIPFLTPEQAYRQLETCKPSGIDALSPMEREIVELCCEGLSSKEIADALHKGLPTINTHMRRALEKTGAHNRTQLAVMWFKAKNRY